MGRPTASQQTGSQDKTLLYNLIAVLEPMGLSAYGTLTCYVDTVDVEQANHMNWEFGMNMTQDEIQNYFLIAVSYGRSVSSEVVWYPPASSFMKGPPGSQPAVTVHPEVYCTKPCYMNIGDQTNSWRGDRCTEPLSTNMV